MAYIRKVVSRVKIVDNDFFVVKGVGVLPFCAPSADGAGRAADHQTESVANAIYEACYCHIGLYELKVPRKPDLLDDLRAANQSSPARAESWGIAASCQKPAPHDMKWEDESCQPGFYYSLGTTPEQSPEDSHRVRFYLNIAPEYAPRWVSIVTFGLNKYRIPFQFKTLRHPVAFSRVDTAVLYLPRRYAALVSSLLQAEASRNEGLREETPPLTRRICSGISLADNPQESDSFGMSRSRLIARGIVRAAARKIDRKEDVIAAVVDSFGDAGIDLRTPWLNPRNTDYELSQKIPASPQSSVFIDNEWLSPADRIGRTLLRDAHWSSGKCTWLDWNLLPEAEGGVYGLTPVGRSFYSGASGIAFFLFQLHEATGDQDYSNAARAAFHYALASALDSKNYPSAYSGDGGILYTWSVFREFLETRQFSRPIGSIFRRLYRSRLPGSQNDIVEGRAGIIDVLLSLHQNQTPYARDALAMAVKLGGELLSSAVDEAQGCSWKTLSTDNERNLLGYAHGTSGICLSLFKLYAVTGDKSFLNAALSGMEYEFANFSRQAGNWPDYRDPELFGLKRKKHEERYMVGWCSGAPGTVMALAYFMRAGHLRKYKTIFDMAVTTTLNSISSSSKTPSADFSLCHGIAGNAAILSSIVDPAKKSKALGTVRQAARAASDIHNWQVSWRCGLPNGKQTLGLMTGLAGIGYSYLVLRNPDIPSPLSFRRVA